MGNWFGDSSSNTSTSSVSAAPWAEERLKTMVSDAYDASKTPFQPFTGEAVAPLSGGQSNAITQLQNTYDVGVPYYNYAADMYGGAAKTLGDLGTAEGIQARMNPYVSNVVDATMRSLDQNNAQQSARLTGNQIMRGSFGGDRAGIGQAELGRQQNIVRDQTISGLMNAGYDKAAEMGLQQANGMSRLAGGMSGLGTTLQQGLIRGATAGLQAGTVEQQTRQAQDNAAYQQFLRGVAFPQDQLTWLSGVLNGASGQSRISSTTTPGPSGTSQAIGLGLTGLSLLGGGNASSGLSSIGNFLSNLFSTGGGVVGDRMGYFTGGGADDGEEGGWREPEMPAMALSQITAPNVLAAKPTTPFGPLPTTAAAGAPYVAAAEPTKPLAIAKPAPAGVAPAAPMPAAPMPAAPAAPSAVPAIGGPDASSGDFNNALMTAGLAMMAGSSPHAMVNIGNAGLAGVQAYRQAQEWRQKQAMAAVELALKRESGAREDKRIDLSAKEIIAKLEEAKLARERQARIDAVEMPYKKALTEKALIDVNKDETADRAKHAAANGLTPGTPAYTTFVLTGKLPETGKATPADQARIKSEQKRMDGYDTGAANAQEMMQSIDQLEQVRKDSWNGPLAGRMPYLMSPSANQTADAIAAKMTLDLATKMKGSLSDKDLMFLSAQTPNTKMSDASAAPLFTAFRAGAQRAIEKNSFMEEYYQRAGSLKGAESAWGKFVSENNVIGKDGNGNTVVNQGAISNWKKYLPGDPSAPQQQQTTKPAAPAADLPVVKSKSDLDQLPSGATYVAPDGKVWRKN